jgi:hypothetical protein
MVCLCMVFCSGAVALSDHLSRGEADVRGVTIKGEEVVITDDHHGAALKLQCVHRTKVAKKQVTALREASVRVIASDI